MPTWVKTIPKRTRTRTRTRRRGVPERRFDQHVTKQRSTNYRPSFFSENFPKWSNWLSKSGGNLPKIGRKIDEKSDTIFSSIWDAILMIFGAKMGPSWKKNQSNI